MNENVSRRTLGTAVMLTLVVIFLLILNPQATFATLFGWAGFLFRVLPQITVRWDGVLWFGGMLTFAIGLTHYVAGWLSDAIQQKRAVERKRPWRFRQTLALIGILLLMFVVGISMAGVVHHVVWLANAPQPTKVSAVQTLADSQRSVYRPEAASEQTGASWITAALPYLPAIAPEMDHAQAWNAADNAEGFRRQVPELICPSQGYPIWSPDGFGLSQAAGSPSWLGRNAAQRLGSEQGLNQSILVGDLNAGLVPWGSPHNARSPALGIRDDWSAAKSGEVGYGSFHHGGANFSMADGSTRFIESTIDPGLLKQLSQGPAKP